jgi:hypothetical protein
MSKGVELILGVRQKTIVLQKAKPIVVEGVPMVVKVRYNEPKLNQQNGSIVRGVPWD